MGLPTLCHSIVMWMIVHIHVVQVDTNVGRICARLGWLPLDAEKALEVVLLS